MFAKALVLLGAPIWLVLSPPCQAYQLIDKSHHEITQTNYSNGLQVSLPASSAKALTAKAGVGVQAKKIKLEMDNIYVRYRFDAPRQALKHFN